jgi:hypothetical protein
VQWLAFPELPLTGDEVAAMTSRALRADQGGPWGAHASAGRSEIRNRSGKLVADAPGLGRYLVTANVAADVKTFAAGWWWWCELKIRVPTHCCHSVAEKLDDSFQV